MNKNILFFTAFSLLCGCASMKKNSIANQYSDEAKDTVEEHTVTAQSYIDHKKVISIKLANIPKENAFLDEPTTLILNDLKFDILVDVLPQAINRPVTISGDLQDKVPDGSSSNVNTIKKTINYSGTKESLLNSICYKLKCSWQVKKDQSIYLSKYKTQYWRMPLLPIDRASKSDITSTSKYGGSASGSGGGSAGEGSGVEGNQSGNEYTSSSGQNIESSFEFKAIETVQSLIDPLVTSDTGESWTYSAQSGLIAVTGSNQTLLSVDLALEQLKSFLTAQVQFNIQLITYDELEDNGFGIDWNIVWEKMGQLGITTNINSNVPSTSDQLALSIIEPNQPFTGTSAFLNALSEFATISSRKEFNYSRLSNQVLPFNIAEVIPYQIITSNIVPDVGITQSYLINKETVGMQMNLTPVILSDEELLVELFFSLSSVSENLEIDLGQFGSARIPQVAKRESLQQALLKTGQTVVMTGFVMEDSEINKRSPLNHKAWFLGGSKNEKRSKQSMVVVITPKIIF